MHSLIFMAIERASFKNFNVSKENLFSNSIQEAYMKIIMNFAQNLMIFTNIDFRWFYAVKMIFIFATSPTGSNYKMISVDCLFKSMLFYLIL